MTNQNPPRCPRAMASSKGAEQHEEKHLDR